MSDPSLGRAEQMGASLRSALRGRSFGERECEALMAVYRLAMEPRVAALPDERHPAYLHPGRSALILLHDVAAVDVSVLVVAALHDSFDEGLRVPGEVIAERVGSSAVEALASIPRPGDERLVERLVTLGSGIALAALAERLDQLRHLHLRHDLVDGWAAVHAEVAQAWLPFAARLDERLARRYAHWTRTFAKRIARMA